MSADVAVDLGLCGSVLAVFCLVARSLHPELLFLTLAAGVGGGALCIAWAILGWYGIRHSRIGAVATLAAISSLAVVQAVRSWQTQGNVESQHRFVVVLMLVMVVFCANMVNNLIQEGKLGQA